MLCIGCIKRKKVLHTWTQINFVGFVILASWIIRTDFYSLHWQNWHTQKLFDSRLRFCFHIFFFIPVLYIFFFKSSKKCSDECEFIYLWCSASDKGQECFRFLFSFALNIFIFAERHFGPLQFTFYEQNKIYVCLYLYYLSVYDRNFVGFLIFQSMHCLSPCSRIPVIFFKWSLQDIIHSRGSS